MVMASMKSNLSGLVKMLKDASGPMHMLYLLLKEQGVDEPITQEEIDLALGKTLFDSTKMAEFVLWLQKKTQTIKKAF
ncbi:hypothetical protein C0995_015302 [Termitomyces sp. Mi166|nr:hypothetical protein C0995_015302 [Termitomyces sp. Mi166\